eukprot:gene54607-36650_t
MRVDRYHGSCTCGDDRYHGSCTCGDDRYHGGYSSSRRYEEYSSRQYGASGGRREDYGRSAAPRGYGERDRDRDREPARPTRAVHAAKEPTRTAAPKRASAR